ncbi:UDP-glucosyltransferase 2-like [Palaemon carinicauda]|uniref:UDP-glucosyltransferase 2-like n=1 Tax=Palaemon carinicauda TaxID=392227 RepID=UPI0035B5DA61
MLNIDEFVLIYGFVESTILIPTFEGGIGYKQTLFACFPSRLTFPEGTMTKTLRVVLLMLLQLQFLRASVGEPTTPRSPVSRPYKVLILGPVGTRSLYHLTRSLSEALGDAGHSVTLVSTFGPSSRHHNVTEMSSGAPVGYLEDFNIFDYRGPFDGFDWVNAAVTKIGHKMWNDEGIKKLWEKRNEFDAIVMISFINEIAAPFLLDYNGVYISFCTPGVEFFSIGHQGNWLPISVVPSIVLPFDDRMSFFERVVNPLTTMAYIIIYRWKTTYLAQTIVDQYFPGVMPPVEELYEKSHLTLINEHFALNGPVPLLPTQVEVGTINAKPPKPLEKDLEEFFEASGDAGVIYFSLGSIVRGKDMPSVYKVMFLEAFRRLPQRVVWKYEGDDLVNDLPTNVIIKKWLPQQDILGHPKTRLFISHCGNLGTQEAKYHGVPVLAVPVAFDQSRNAARMARKGFGLVLNWEDMSADAIFDAVQTLLTDPSYATRIKQVSEAIKDQKETPAERAVWWIEYVIRAHARNSSSLEYAGKRLYFLQYIMMDVIVFWVAVLILWTVAFYYICKCVYSCCIGGRREKIEKKKKVA